MEFSLKPVTFFGRTCVIICQNENGPCPLLAIANILLLQNRITVNPDRGILPLAELIQIVANAILEKIGNSSLPEHITLVESVLNILPKLAHGLDLNVRFTGVDKFEFTEEISVFDALGIRLLHGWLCNPAEAEEAGVLGDMSYNHVLFRLVEYKSLSAKRDHPDSSATEEKEISDDPMSSAKELKEGSAKTPQERRNLQFQGAVLERFLQKTASQFTYHGMLALYNAMQDRQFAVFFRNNHFSALYFYNGQLFTLVTDLGYRHEPTVVWELLNSIDGDCEFYNSEFAPLSSLTPISSPGFFSNFPDVHAAVPISPGATSASPYPGGGTIAAPPAGYKFAPTTCAPPAVTLQSSSSVSPVPVQDTAHEGEFRRTGDVSASVVEPTITAATPVDAEDGTESSNDATPSAGVDQGPAEQPPDLSCAPAETSKAELTAADAAEEEDSYEVIDANSLISPAAELSVADHHAEQNGHAAFATTAVEPTQPEAQAGLAVSDEDEAVHIPTVTQPLPKGDLTPAPGSATEPLTPAVPAAAAATVSSYDDDLRLAMELQAQEDAQACALAMADSHWSAPTPETAPYRSASVPAQQDTFLSQEESDRQHALMLHHQQVEEQQEHLQRLQQQRQQYQQQRPATAAAPAPAQRYSSGGFPYNQSNEQRRSSTSGGKKDNCSIS